MAVAIDEVVLSVVVMENVSCANNFVTRSSRALNGRAEVTTRFYSQQQVGPLMGKLYGFWKVEQNFI
ncbi:uncharacterized protein PHALS_13691 [Plasmopara halstedii]|uniref:Uncharacterized protein n=1 Tax=Plasmopara halstedii TaxID=4781 RepID=A0A0P1APR8_PLAHL|nr:uncharacterized protein PHALS_13691 [Plasmopara halstedii]CEG43498.1 hypothetical protein PHALS_13691 [Plasmopara halstedii]|eukprot:XP_024579867.1 hypothetical protein PHALS_13691 [Plasmopara halstedii]